MMQCQTGAAAAAAAQAAPWLDALHQIGQERSRDIVTQQGSMLCRHCSVHANLLAQQLCGFIGEACSCCFLIFFFNTTGNNTSFKICPFSMFFVKKTRAENWEVEVKHLGHLTRLLLNWYWTG